MQEQSGVFHTESDFLNLRVAHDFGDLRNWAEWVVSEYTCDFERLERLAFQEWRSYDFPVLGGCWNYRCQYLYDAFDYSRMGKIELTKRFVLGNGHHRSLALACLLVQDKIAYQPVSWFVQRRSTTDTGEQWVYGSVPRFDRRGAFERELLDTVALEHESRKSWTDSDWERVLERSEARDKVDMSADVFCPFGV